MTTSNDPDEIRADIERTRAALSDDVDDLAESVKPKNVAGRQVGKVKEAASYVKERVMGSDDDDYSGSAVGTVADKASSAKDTVGEKASEAGEAVQAGAEKDEAEGAGQSPGRRHDRLWPRNAGLLADSFHREGARGRVPAARKPGAGEGEGLRSGEGYRREPEAGSAGGCRVGKDNGSGGRRERQAGRSIGSRRRQGPSPGLKGDGAATVELTPSQSVDSLQ